ncbi:MAG: sugar ABC transporter permease, partial [Alphaproteobacteria bacterium]|nr:sugar ABC transporter permease [Alphaproteobacteria bacterium]
MTRASATIHGWLLLLPAAVLLGAFTHWPTVATIWQSFYSTPKGNRPSRYIGLD